MRTTVWVTVGGKLHKVVLGPGGSTEVDDKAVSLDACQLQPGLLSLLLTSADGSTRSFRCVTDATAEASAVIIEGRRFPYAIADPRSLRAATLAAGGDSGPRPVKAPMPGRVVRVLVAPGETVTQGQGCVVIEAMKMQNELKAPKAGVVARLAATVGSTVTQGHTLLWIE